MQLPHPQHATTPTAYHSLHSPHLQDDAVAARVEAAPPRAPRHLRQLVAGQSADASAPLPPPPLRCRLLSPPLQGRQGSQQGRARRAPQRPRRRPAAAPRLQQLVVREHADAAVAAARQRRDQRGARRHVDARGQRLGGKHQLEEAWRARGLGAGLSRVAESRRGTRDAGVCGQGCCAARPASCTPPSSSTPSARPAGTGAPPGPQYTSSNHTSNKG